MIRLVVWMTLPSGEQIRSGEIVCADADSHGKILGGFRYTSEWIGHSKGFALDPNVLPLARTEYESHRPQGIFAVFEDALPDDWGRRLLIRKSGLPRGKQTLPNLLKVLNGNALGALSFFPEAFERIEHPLPSILDLDKLTDAALRYDAGEALDQPDLQLLFTAASPPGGARPKALVDTGDGHHWIAKFPSSKDQLDLISIEAATMDLAGRAGLQVPDFRVQPCGINKVLLVKRFDITNRGGRRHMISYQTLMQAEGYYTLGYMDLFEPLRRISNKPAIDIPALYRQMVFNALVGNTDDHLKNFSLLHDDSGYHLSPVYDLLPDTAGRREHVLHFSPDFHFPGKAHLSKLGKSSRIAGAPNILADVYSAVSEWREVFCQWGVPKPILNVCREALLEGLKENKRKLPNAHPVK